MTAGARPSLIWAAPPQSPPPVVMGIDERGYAMPAAGGSSAEGESAVTTSSAGMDAAVGSVFAGAICVAILVALGFACARCARAQHRRNRGFTRALTTDDRDWEMDG